MVRGDRYAFTRHHAPRRWHHQPCEVAGQNGFETPAWEPFLGLAEPRGELTVDVDEARFHVKGGNQRRQGVDDRA